MSTCEGEAGSESGARVQMMLRRERGIMVKKEQGRTTESPWMASMLDSRTVTRTASGKGRGGQHWGLGTQRTQRRTALWTGVTEDTEGQARKSSHRTDF